MATQTTLSPNGVSRPPWGSFAGKISTQLTRVYMTISEVAGSRVMMEVGEVASSRVLMGVTEVAGSRVFCHVTEDKPS